jgi:glycosyltransferase involved in cell wall biosynthesis
MDEPSAAQEQPAATRPVVRVLGIRGIPARHGGFETFAERLAQHLRDRGWRPVVYCQSDAPTGRAWRDQWEGIERVHIPVGKHATWGPVIFDLRATLHAARSGGICLTLGYNTALFTLLIRRAHLPNLINMDGIEWARGKWGAVAKAWFRLNERAGCRLADSIIADHPQIAAHLETRGGRGKIAVIPYGADAVEGAPTGPVEAFGLTPGRYATVIARPEPENSILEIVRAYSRCRRTFDLALIGNYEAGHSYQRAVKAAAGPRVRFLGAVYEPATVRALRAHALLHVHGHQVGGTNPSLVEALGAGNAVFAHDNRFNRWVAGDAALYFQGEDDLARLFESVDRSTCDLGALRAAARRRHRESFPWPAVLGAYEELLRSFEHGIGREGVRGGSASAVDQCPHPDPLPRSGRGSSVARRL